MKIWVGIWLLKICSSITINIPIWGNECKENLVYISDRRVATINILTDKLKHKNKNYLLNLSMLPDVLKYIWMIFEIRLLNFMTYNEKITGLDNIDDVCIDYYLGR